MGLFDFFKKKTPEPAAPSAPQSTRLVPAETDSLSLEELLRLASTEEGVRAAFYERLMADDLIIITPNPEGEGQTTLEAGTTLAILPLEDGRLPVFTSPERIFDNGVIQEEVPITKLSGGALFEATKGATFVLNPFSEYGKVLIPSEIGYMLDGTAGNGYQRTIEIKKDTEVLLGQPAEYPHSLVAEFKSIFARNPAIQAAFLGWMHMPESGDPPHYVVGIEMAPGAVPDQVQDAVEEAGGAIRNHLRPDQIVDFVQVTGTDGLSGYFRTIDPFYRR